jgi:hypothetical protein
LLLFRATLRLLGPVQLAHRSQVVTEQERWPFSTKQHRFLISPATALAHVSASAIVVISAGTARLL